MKKNTKQTSKQKEYLWLLRSISDTFQPEIMFYPVPYIHISKYTHAHTHTHIQTHTD